MKLSITFPTGQEKQQYGTDPDALILWKFSPGHLRSLPKNNSGSFAALHQPHGRGISENPPSCLMDARICFIVQCPLEAVTSHCSRNSVNREKCFLTGYAPAGKN